MSKERDMKIAEAVRNAAREEVSFNEDITMRNIENLDLQVIVDSIPDDQTLVPVGPAGTMPGTDGFTMAAFRKSDVAVGEQLYIVKKT